MSMNTILLVESNPAERENFIKLAQRENLTTEVVGSSYEAIQWLKKNDHALAIVIAEDATPLNAYQTFDYIRQELKSNLPVVISKLGEGKPKEGNHNYIDKPFTSIALKGLSNSLVPNTSSASGLKVYSLEYLETITVGNHDFMIDLLQTFMTSVNEKMKELKTAVEESDYKTVGAIAHNIKPSFEMLENEKAKNICNKLTYEAETSDVPALANELNDEFRAIEQALKNDFEELK
ncbi:Hpt domain-containing protein [Flavobacterium sp. AG291]|uniref:Hpt domain-containing response regulator n=1 Tax=Flavobacterium sp. AG291 TaxID=2184000 RepID=UPI000E0A2C45|nr:Hpt domain-containing protein [Flavobacterium sp. AG291]RDI06715.1 HPt (histidine-containing phosphotransfer) domain-containing protein [Flavobacterium sp. AG291]